MNIKKSFSLLWGCHSTGTDCPEVMKFLSLVEVQELLGYDLGQQTLAVPAWVGDLDKMTFSSPFQLCDYVTFTPLIKKTWKKMPSFSKKGPALWWMLFWSEIDELKIMLSVYLLFYPSHKNFGRWQFKLLWHSIQHKNYC